MTDPTTHPDAFVGGIVGLAGPPSMADDRVIAANRASPREEVQRDHPGSMLSFASGSAIKRITAGVKARHDRPCQDSISWPGLHPPVKSVSNEKRILLSVGEREAPALHIGRFISTFRPRRSPSTMHVAP
jgi:hypothetical protein